MKLGIVDLKKSGISQDLKELKKDKLAEARARRIVSKIRSEGKERESKYKKEYTSKLKERDNVFSQAERKTITDREDYKKYKEELGRASKISPKREKLKYYAKKGLSKVDTAMNVGLERGYQKLAQVSRQRVISRPVLKKSSMGVNIPDFKAPSILGDENRFFKGEFNKEKRSMFFE